MQKLKPQLVKAFFNYVNERHGIYQARKAGAPFPWTDDPILRKYKFCNVLRELDKVTIWIRENWREPYARHPNLWFAMAVARQINWPETLAEIGFPERWDPDRVAAMIRSRQARGLTAYTGAYMLTGTLGGDKAGQTVYKILDPLFKDPPPLKSVGTLESAFNMFLGRPGFGPFMSYEVVTDLRHTHYLNKSTDIMTWANAGPGACRGINRMLGLPTKPFKQLKTQEYLEYMEHLLIISPLYLGDHVPALEMRDIEHCLCETDKYLRIKNGEGRTRSLYKLPGLV